MKSEKIISFPGIHTNEVKEVDEIKKIFFKMMIAQKGCLGFIALMDCIVEVILNFNCEEGDREMDLIFAYIYREVEKRREKSSR